MSKHNKYFKKTPEECVGSIYDLMSSDQLDPYLSYIRFPHFRNLKRDLRIDFDFPIVVLVGQNGTNKSSILRAVYGCPGNNSLGDFWFSTKIDPINSDEEHSIIYGYFQPAAKQDAEVIKRRSARKFPRTIGKRKVQWLNPDYWEPSRPIRNLGMKRMEKLKDGEPLLGRSKTRWNAIDKKVLFLDFRGEISAYDKYFYHGDLNKTIRRHSKQDFIRERSVHLNKVVEGGVKEYKFHGKNRVSKNFHLNEKEVEIVSFILDREYSDIQVVKHSLFNADGYSVIMKGHHANYSEAWAGSGEFAVVILVHRILRQESRSLIILDEPEVSLHPGAQYRLSWFLLEAIKEFKHQIVIGSHSPFMIKELPSSAVKTLYMDPASHKIDVVQKTAPSEAFFHLGINDYSSHKVYVEDKLAVEVVKKLLRSLGEASFSSVSVVAPPGGAESMLCQHMPVVAEQGHDNTVMILDGDKNYNVEVPDDDVLRVKSSHELFEILRNFVGGKPTIPRDGKGKSGEEDEGYKSSLLKCLAFCRDNIRYLPRLIPEEFIWDKSALNEEFPEINDKCFKQRFVELARYELGRSAYESVSSGDILQTQIRRLRSISDNDPELVDLTGFIREKLEKH